MVDHHSGLEVRFGSEPASGSESRVTPAGSTKTYVLNMRNGLPYLSKELFWLAMEDVSKRAELLARHSWRELKEMLENYTQETHPHIYSVKTVEVPKPPDVVFTMVPRTPHLFLQRCERPSWLHLIVSERLQTPIEVGCRIQLCL